MSLDGEARTLGATPGAAAVGRFEPGPGLLYYATRVFTLHLRTTPRPSEAAREAVPFVQVLIETGPPPANLPRQ